MYVFQNQLLQQQASGELVLTEQNDVLSMALEKHEHPGRIRGVGQDVTIRKYWPSQSKGASSSTARGDGDSIDEARRQIEDRIKGEMMVSLKAMESSFGAKIQALEDIIRQLVEKQNKEGSPIVGLGEEAGTRTPIPEAPCRPTSGKASCSIHKGTVSASDEQVCTTIQ